MRVHIPHGRGPFEGGMCTAPLVRWSCPILAPCRHQSSSRIGRNQSHAAEASYVSDAAYCQITVAACYRWAHTKTAVLTTHWVCISHNARLFRRYVALSGCTVVSGVCNRSQMRTPKCTCLIFGVSVGLDPGWKCTKGIFDRSKFKVTSDISPTSLERVRGLFQTRRA